MARLAAEEGMSLDVSTGGELSVVLAAGVPPDRIGQYVQCEVNIPELPDPLIAELRIASATVTLSEAQFQALSKGHANIVLTLLTADGTRRSARPRQAA